MYDAAILDAQSAEAFLVSQLTYIEREVYRIVYPQIRYPAIVPVDMSAPPWIPSVTYFSLDGVGKAQWFNGRANDVPLAEVLRAKYETPVKMAAIGYEFDLEELSQAQMLGRNLTTDKAYYARLASDEFIDNAAIFGDASVGYLGLCNNPTVAQVTAAAGASGYTQWAKKTPAEILQDFNAALSGPFVATNTVEMANTVLVPPLGFSQIASTMVNTNSTETILQFVQRSNVYTARTNQPIQIEPIFGLDTAGSGGTARMVAYWKNPAVVKMHMPMPFRFIDQPWRDGPMLWKVPGIFRFGGVDIKRPGAFRYIDGIA